MRGQARREERIAAQRKAAHEIVVGHVEDEATRHVHLGADAIDDAHHFERLRRRLPCLDGDRRVRRHDVNARQDVTHGCGFGSPVGGRRVVERRAVFAESARLGNAPVGRLRAGASSARAHDGSRHGRPHCGRQYEVQAHAKIILRLQVAKRLNKETRCDLCAGSPTVRPPGPLPCPGFAGGRVRSRRSSRPPTRALTAVAQAGGDSVDREVDAAADPLAVARPGTAQAARPAGG